MLIQLTINNFAIVDNLEINFKICNGLIVLTGETGAGKSIIVDALDFLLGARASQDLIKSGTEKSIVEAQFFLEKHQINDLQHWFCDNGIDFPSDSNIYISRELTFQGSRAKINGSLANVTQLMFLRSILLNIHWQSEHMELLKPEKQVEILDNFGGKSHLDLVSAYRICFEEYEKLKADLIYSKDRSVSLDREIEFLGYEINEIKNARVNNVNEDKELQSKREILLNKRELLENANLIYELTTGEDPNNILGLLFQVKKLLSRSSTHDESFKEYLLSVENLISEAKELASFVNNYSSKVDTGVHNLEEIEERLDLLTTIKKKYGDSLENVKEHFIETQKKLAELENFDSSCEHLEKTFKEKELKLNLFAEKLTLSREEIAKEFVNKINDELQTLGFRNVIFVVEFINCNLFSSGKEKINFLFTANPDEQPKPLLKVASGGELSRIMLAVKSIVCRGVSQYPSTMLFDEIDIGVSGEIASSVARKLYKISRYNQIICITHQPIIAAMADYHFVVEKKVNNGLTNIALKELSHSEKPEALANLLAPEKRLKDITNDAKQYANSLLENAKKMKKREFIAL